MKIALFVICTFLVTVGSSVPGWCDTEALIEAIKSGDIQAIQKLIAKGMNLNQLDKYEQTPLYWAAGEGNVEIARMLIEASGARV